MVRSCENVQESQPHKKLSLYKLTSYLLVGVNMNIMAKKLVQITEIKAKGKTGNVYRTDAYLFPFKAI